jgi:ABC-type nitrate/sulfonate/bicarbonate transport system permease component
MSVSRSQNVLGAVVSSLLENEYIIFTISFLSFLLLWTIVSITFELQEVIRTPWYVALATVDLIVSLRWVTDVVNSLRRIVLAFGFALTLGTIVGVLMGVSNFWEKALQDYIIVGMTLPGLFATVFAAMWFGVSDAVPMVAAGLTVYAFCSLLVYEGIKDLDYRLFEMAESFNLSRKRAIKRVMIQGLLPEWFSAARYAFAVSWKITLLAEFVAASNGIGWRIREFMGLLDFVAVLSWTAFFVGIMLVWEYGILRSIEQRLFDWREESETIGW